MSLLETLRMAPPALAIVINLVLLVLVMRAPRKTALYLAFATFLGSMALWALLSLGLAAKPSSSMAPFWQRTVLASIALVAATYLHFVLLLTRRITTLRPATIVYLAGGLLLSAALTPLVVARVDAVSYGWAPVGGGLTAAWLGLIEGFFFASVVVLGLAYWRSGVSEEKNRYALFALGALSGMLGIATDFLAAQGLMAYPFGVFGGIGLTLLAGMAAMRHNLLNVQVAFRRGVVYLAFSVAITALYVLVVVVLGQFLAQREGFPFYIQAIIVFGLALAFTPAVRYLGDMADRWVYGKRSDYLRLLRSIATSSQRLTELPALARDLTDALRVAMRASDVWLLLPNPKGDYAPTLGDGPALDVNSPILRWLQQNPRPLSRGLMESPTFPERPSEEERAALRIWDVRLLVPMRAPSGLLGVMALGPPSDPGKVLPDGDGRPLHGSPAGGGICGERAPLHGGAGAGPVLAGAGPHEGRFPGHDIAPVEDAHHVHNDGDGLAARE
ncbi:MAG: hypothetical protein Q8O40_13430 [Chloroflexota bacterium]|nr:hypothetical protein [Chloroflexota bacterium]